MASRENIRFESDQEQCCGWFYQSTSDYYIIMAHGLAGVKEMRLDAYAERFTQAGYNVLVFDYRHFGESSGKPRQLLSVKKQHRDWLAAIDHVRLEYKAPTGRIFLWGSSLSGGHVMAIANQRPELAGIISQVPHVSGFAGVKAAGPIQGMKLTCLGLYDIGRSLLGFSPYYVKASGGPGETALMTSPGAHEGYHNIVPSGHNFDNRVTARFALDASRYNPGQKLKSLNMPALVQVGVKDLITPPTPVVKACKLAANTQLKTYELDHFEPYVDPNFDTFVTDQIDFLNRVSQI